MIYTFSGIEQCTNPLFSLFKLFMNREVEYCILLMESKFNLTYSNKKGGSFCSLREWRSFVHDTYNFYVEYVNKMHN